MKCVRQHSTLKEWHMLQISILNFNFLFLRRTVEVELRVQLLHFISYKSSKRKRIKLQSKSYSLLVFVYSESTLCRPLKSGACHKYFNFLFFTDSKSRVQLLHFFLYKSNKKEQIKRQSRNSSLSLLLSFPQKILLSFYTHLFSVLIIPIYSQKKIVSLYSHK